MASKAFKKLPCGRPLPPAGESEADPGALLMEMQKRLADYVEKRNLNRSEAREKILRTIVLEARHFTAIDLLERLSARHPEVGKATLYRNLPILVDSGILSEGPMDPDGQVLYELAEDEHHDHIFCMDCRKIFEFHDEAIEKRQDAIAESMGFHTQGHRHVVFAACDYLKKN